MTHKLNKLIHLAVVRVPVGGYYTTLRSVLRYAPWFWFATLPLCGANAPQLWYNSPANQWGEALPIGNGRLAAMVFSGIDTEHLQLNEESIFAGQQMDRVNPQARENVLTVRKLLLAGQVLEAQALTEKALLAIPRRQPPYEPLGDLNLTFDGTEPSQAQHYRRSLDLYDGVLTTEYDLNGVHYSRTVFASYPDGAIVLHLTASRNHSLSFTAELSRVENAESKLDPSFGKNVIVLRGKALPPPNKQYTNEPRNGTAFTGALRILSDGEVTAGNDQRLHVSQETEVTLLFTAATDARGTDPDTRCREQLKRASRYSYLDLLSRHRTDFRSLSTRVSLQLGDSYATMKTVPTDQLLERAKAGEDDTALVSLYFAYGRYLLQSSSRLNSLPANLQGKWNNKVDPPWGSKYTININTEMNYWPAEVGNLGETVDAVYNLLRLMQDNGRRTAQEMYGTDGFVAHHNTDGWADTEPIDGVPSGMWPFGAAWLSLTLWDHYDYSRDLGYLRDRAYPILRDAAVYVLNNLFDDGAGHLVSGPSLSPENSYYTPDHKKASLDVSPTMDIEITTALFRHVIEASHLLGTDADLRQRLSQALPKLIPLQIGRYGQLQEWRQDYEEVEPGHRHLSHLLAVYPSNEINPSRPDLYRAARVSLERRLTNKGGGTGWSRAWVVCLWATFREGDKADDSLRVLFTRSTWPNLFDLHPPEIFQIDGNLGATAGIAQMLLQSQNGTIELLPALPSSWQEGSVTGLRARGGLTLDFIWRAGRVQTATLHATHSGLFQLQIPGRKPLPVTLKARETRTLSF
jgi:alpha-L-fucosidase 2